MTITLDYAAFVPVLFWLFVVKGLLYIVVGIAQGEKDTRTHYGIIEALFGIVMLLFAIWIVVI